MSLVRGATLPAIVCAVASLSAAAPLAYAQDPGVVFEPGSPSSKEYAIPLEEARRDGGGARRRGGGYVPFGVGVGITTSPGGTGGSATATGGSGQDDRGAAADGGAFADGAGRADGGGRAGADGAGNLQGEAGLSPERARALRERLADAEQASASLLWKLAPYLLVLLPGLIVGLLLARRGPREPLS